MVPYLSVAAAVILAALLAFAARALILGVLDRPQRRSLLAFRVGNPLRHTYRLVLTPGGLSAS